MSIPMHYLKNHIYLIGLSSLVALHFAMTTGVHVYMSITAWVPEASRSDLHVILSVGRVMRLYNDALGLLAIRRRGKQIVSFY